MWCQMADGQGTPVSACCRRRREKPAKTDIVAFEGKYAIVENIVRALLSQHTILPYR